MDFVRGVFLPFNWPMGFPRYRGAVTTVHHVMQLDGHVLIRCEMCGHIKRIRARGLWDMARDRLEWLCALPLLRPITGFRCTACRGTLAMIEAERKW